MGNRFILSKKITDICLRSVINGSLVQDKGERDACGIPTTQGKKKKKQAEHTQSNDVYLTVLNIIAVKSKIPQG